MNLLSKTINGAGKPALILISLSLWSSAAWAQQYSRTDTFTYEDNLASWVVGQPKTSTNVETGAVETKTDYDPSTALKIRSYRFGVLQNSFTYNADGTPATVKDGAGHTVTFTSWKRGIPQSIKFPATAESPTGSTQSAVVDNLGLLNSVTNQAGYTTGYTYDAVGRLAQTTYPSNDDVAWNASTTTFVPVSTAEFGIPAGHWKETQTTGTGRAITYFDALWRPVLVQTQDTANMSGTTSFVIKRYDTDGREVYRSYPVASIGTVADSLPGTTTSYDVLGRVMTLQQDSERGVLLTTYQYQTGFKTLMTSPRSVKSTLEYQVFDVPTTSTPVRIVNAVGLPEQQTTTITRDVFGKPLTITRSGS